MHCSMENFVKPANENKNMEEVVLVDDANVFIFDIDEEFYTFCDEKQLMIMYENAKKLDLIHKKALELGLTGEKENEEIPVEMEKYWEELFGYPIPVESKALAGRLWSERNLTGSYYNFIPLFWPTFGKFNDKARSATLSMPMFGWLCTKTWFGGSKLGYATMMNKRFNSFSPTFDKKLRSSFSF